MWQKVKQLNAMEPKELMPNKNIFCHWCYYFSSGIQKRDQPYAGWGGHSPDICWRRPEQSQEMCDYVSQKERKEEDLVKGSPPNPNWGSEPQKMKGEPRLVKVADVKSGGEEAEEKKKRDEKRDEKKEEKKKKKADDTKGSARDKPKKDKKDDHKKRKCSDSSDIGKRAKKAGRNEDELL